jgi:hypothetical protein
LAHPYRPSATTLRRHILLVSGAALVGWSLGFALGWGVLAFRGIGDHE